MLARSRPPAERCGPLKSASWAARELQFRNVDRGQDGVLVGPNPAAPKEADLPFETIAVQVTSRGIATVLLNRPDRGNAFNRAMLAELGRALEALAADAAVRLAVLRGAGAHFCAGADLADRSEQTAPPTGPAMLDVLAALDNLPKPTIAAVDGGAIGGGAAIAACCDIVVATDAAFFSIPEVRIGMAPVRLAPLFIRAMGQRSFRRYGLSGERIAAAEALRIGLAHQLCPAAALDAIVAEIADALLHGAPGAIGELKSALTRLATPPWPTGASAAHARTAEATEGVASFREKRKPSWYPG
jgi:methylglutaconyl-CoA hydratase